MRVLFFGTFDESKHPRVRVLREGLTRHLGEVGVCNVPLEFDTAARVSVAAEPWRAPLLLWRMAACWVRLLWKSRIYRPDVVVVGYLGHFDVHLARLRYPKAVVVLDHLVSLEGTVRDRGLGRSGGLSRVLRLVDHLALRRADLVLVDTDEQRDLVPSRWATRCLVVPVGATRDWAAARRSVAASDVAGDGPADASQPLSVAFFGLFTPLQGTAVIGEAIGMVPDAPIRWTMIGSGQDHDATRRAAADNPAVTWIDWLSEEDLQRAVARHDVCLGIFGTTPKALRVVPNKVYQGAMAGCVVVTSDTPPQRRILGSAALFVPPGDPVALAEVLRDLARDAARVRSMQSRASSLALRDFTPAALTEPLIRRLEKLS